MMRKPLSFLVFLPIALFVVAAPVDDMTRYRDESRRIVQGFAARLGGELQKAMKANGPASAIRVCRDLAPAIASDASRASGSKVGRVSLKARNAALGLPDEWEQRVLADFEKRMGTQDAAGMEFAEVVTEPQGRFYRYMKAIPMQGACLRCHGAGDAIPREVKNALKTEYPHDKAVDYAEGQVRGAFSIKRPL